MFQQSPFTAVLLRVWKDDLSRRHGQIQTVIQTVKRGGLCFKGVVDFFERLAERVFQKNQRNYSVNVVARDARYQTL
jgi:hypothetical protein